LLRSAVPILLLVSLLALPACGKNPDVDLASYSCADFNKSLKSKDDESAGRFINQLREKARLGQGEKVERREVTLGIIYTCRGTKGSVKPANKAIAYAKRLAKKSTK
jgi:hypothetical protein